MWSEAALVVAAAAAAAAAAVVVMDSRRGCRARGVLTAIHHPGGTRTLSE